MTNSSVEGGLENTRAAGPEELLRAKSRESTQYRYHALFNGSQFFWSGCLAGAICHKPPGYVGASAADAPTYPGGLWHMVSVGQPDPTDTSHWHKWHFKIVYTPGINTLHPS